MRSLAIDSHLVRGVLNGGKTTEFRRLDRSLPDLGEVVALRCRQDPPFAYVRIISVEPFEWADIDDDVAHADGLILGAVLLRILRERYGENAPLARVTFERVPAPEEG